MKYGLPTTDHLSRLYYELGQAGARSVGENKPWPYHFKTVEEMIALAADWSRYDPRLLQILVGWSLKSWNQWNPVSLRKAMQQMTTPQTLGVISEFLSAADPANRELQLFLNHLTADLKPLPPQFYFFDLYLPGSKMAERATKESLDEFKSWGFLGRERVVVDAKTKSGVGNWDQPSRLNILRRLFKNKKQIQISDYLEELHHSISRQQALLDLKILPAKSQGGGRSAFWIL